MEVGVAVELRDTLLLRSMDGEKAIEYLRVALAGILVLDELNEFPDGCFARVVGGGNLTAQTLAEALAELELVVGGQVGVVKVVVAVGIEKAVGEQGRGEFHGLAEKGLQAAGGPGIAAGLDGVGHAEGWVKAACPPRELRADGQEVVGEELDCFAFKTERGGCEAGKECDDALLYAEALGWRAWHAPGFTLDGAQALVIGLFALALLVRSAARGIGKGGQRASVPQRDGLLNLCLDP